MKTPGFLLTEFLVYLVLISLLALLAFPLLSSVVGHITTVDRKLQWYLQVLGACESMRELKGADAVVFKSSTELMWHISDVWHALNLEKGLLKRVVGTFDQATGRWSVRNVTILARNVRGVFVLYGKTAVTLCLASVQDDFSLEYCVALSQQSYLYDE